MATNARRCSGAVVWCENEHGYIQVLLVRSNGSGSWVFPKGGVEPGLTPQQNAVKECWEEAGVLGHIGHCLGQYRYSKNGDRQSVLMYEMQLVAELDEYPEKGLRKRKWFFLDDAMQKVGKDLRRLLEELAHVHDLSDDDDGVYRKAA